MICQVDMIPCRIASYLGNSFEGEVEEALPCDRCRVGEEQVKALRGRQLGIIQRHILASLPEPNDDPVYLASEKQAPRRRRTAVLRALRSLREAGLVESPNREVWWNVWLGRLTHIGKAVRDVTDLRDRIRWDVALPLVWKHAILDDESLLELFLDRSKRRLRLAREHGVNE